AGSVISGKCLSPVFKRERQLIHRAICSAFSDAFCHVCITAKPGECPPQTSGSSCTVSCNSDSNCPNNEKCCSNGCGRYCTAPYTVKPGQCPKPKRVPECAESCFHDGQCPATQKCCPTTCGHVCTTQQGYTVFFQIKAYRCWSYN
uniref:WAP domain-containing protein n=1 Tax=Cyprinus carpio TaxID=7962 RepID=A0A8C2KDW8_CYPCA